MLYNRIVKQERELGMSIHKTSKKFVVWDNVGQFALFYGSYKDCKCYIDSVKG